MAAEGDHIRRYNYTGADGEVIPDYATHVTVDESVRVIRRRAFYCHPNIVEVICGPNVEKVEECAFIYCILLRRVIMPGVEVVEGGAFHKCWALTNVECGKLEIIRCQAFLWCPYLRSIDLTSTRIVQYGAFCNTALTEATFGNKLERIERSAFAGCRSLHRITIPLKDGIITRDNIFAGCENLKHVDLLRDQYMKLSPLYYWRNGETI